ncbi:hypothetical protein [uncultured Hoeflea sp.]|uniref:hypothetical protein n=1 Tax=uncultured Hoeflea sp. TaxID=538666 RepID=UPI00261E490E|nr:hypothetical protein [uncultured Hoeflea sp.]
MTNMSKDLFLSILSMDSYNRGYSAGIADLSDDNETSIGNARIVRASSSLDTSPEVAAGFYAVAYQWNGQTVISYRGTDTLIDWTNLDPWSDTPCGDFCNAYLTGLGSSATAQAQRRRCLPGSMP